MGSIPGLHVIVEIVALETPPRYRYFYPFWVCRCCAWGGGGSGDTRRRSASILQHPGIVLCHPRSSRELPMLQGLVLCQDDCIGTVAQLLLIAPVEDRIDRLDARMIVES